MDENDRPVIFFDGHCGLCNRSVDAVLRRDKGHVFRFAPLQGETAGAIFTDMTEEERMNSFLLKDEDGVHDRSTAALRVSRRLGGLASLLYALIIVPRPVRDWVYGLVARHRYKIWGRSDSCRIPTADERPYFLP
ncbi:MAG: DCC1-like thiol-disulfide oxidoreductase family protein [Fimbriimonadaceae bacterium]